MAMNWVKRLLALLRVVKPVLKKEKTAAKVGVAIDALDALVNAEQETQEKDAQK